jgi:hypothetical protein
MATRPTPQVPPAAAALAPPPINLATHPIPVAIRTSAAPHPITGVSQPVHGATVVVAPAVNNAAVLSALNEFEPALSCPM